MAVKTITIDMDAYDLLVSQKRKSESFSQVIKRKLGPAVTAADLLNDLDDLLLDQHTLDRIEKIVERRKDSLSRDAQHYQLIPGLVVETY